MSQSDTMRRPKWINSNKGLVALRSLQFDTTKQYCTMTLTKRRTKNIQKVVIQGRPLGQEVDLLASYVCVSSCFYVFLFLCICVLFHLVLIEFCIFVLGYVCILWSRAKYLDHLAGQLTPLWSDSSLMVARPPSATVPDVQMQVAQMHRYKNTRNTKTKHVNGPELCNSSKCANQLVQQNMVRNCAIG